MVFKVRRGHVVGIAALHGKPVNTATASIVSCCVAYECVQQTDSKAKVLL
jgi:hypothetical protein